MGISEFCLCFPLSLTSGQIVSVWNVLKSIKKLYHIFLRRNMIFGSCIFLKCLKIPGSKPTESLLRRDLNVDNYAGNYEHFYVLASFTI